MKCPICGKPLDILHTDKTQSGEVTIRTYGHKASKCPYTGKGYDALRGVDHRVFIEEMMDFLREIERG